MSPYPSWNPRTHERPSRQAPHRPGRGRPHRRRVPAGTPAAGGLCLRLVPACPGRPAGHPRAPPPPGTERHPYAGHGRRGLLRTTATGRRRLPPGDFHHRLWQHRAGCAPAAARRRRLHRQADRPQGPAAAPARAAGADRLATGPRGGAGHAALLRADPAPGPAPRGRDPDPRRVGRGQGGAGPPHPRHPEPAGPVRGAQLRGPAARAGG